MDLWPIPLIFNVHNSPKKLPIPLKNGQLRRISQRDRHFKMATFNCLSGMSQTIRVMFVNSSMSQLAAPAKEIF